MNEQSNNFIFSFYINDELINTRSFSADVYNPNVRYSVNIRDMIPSIIYRLQNTMSQKEGEYYYNDGDGGLSLIDDIMVYNMSLGYDIYEKFQVKNKEFSVGNKKLSGVSAKFVLYINDNTIVERIFAIRGYNPKMRYSNELIELMRDIVEEIQLYLKDQDIKYLWNDYLIKDKYNMNNQMVRNMSSEKRERIISNL